MLPFFAIHPEGWFDARISKKGGGNTITRKRTSKYIGGNESVFFWVARMVFFPCGNKDRFYLVKIRGAKKNTENSPIEKMRKISGGGAHNSHMRDRTFLGKIKVRNFFWLNHSGGKKGAWGLLRRQHIAKNQFCQMMFIVSTEGLGRDPGVGPGDFNTMASCHRHQPSLGERRSSRAITPPLPPHSYRLDGGL